MSEAAEELKSELDNRELMANVRYLEDALHSEQRNNEMAYLRGMVDGLKYSIRCNGVSGAEVRERGRMSSFAKERDKAFTDAVVNDKWDGVKRYAKKYGVPFPKSEKVMKAGIYKAVQYCTDIPEDVKTLAVQKCLEMGFNPFIRPIGEGSVNHDD